MPRIGISDEDVAQLAKRKQCYMGPGLTMAPYGFEKLLRVFRIAPNPKPKTPKPLNPKPLKFRGSGFYGSRPLAQRVSRSSGAGFGQGQPMQGPTEERQRRGLGLRGLGV